MITLAARLLLNPELRAEHKLSALDRINKLWFVDRRGQFRWAIDNSVIEALVGD